MFIIILFSYNKDLSIALLVNWYFLEFLAEMSKFKSLFTIITIYMCVFNSLRIEDSILIDVIQFSFFSF